MATLITAVDVDLSYLTQPEQDQILEVIERDRQEQQELLQRIESVSLHLSLSPFSTIRLYIHLCRRIAL